MDLSYMNLLDPYNRRLERIYDSTFKRNVEVVDGKILESGSYEAVYTEFKTSRLASGNDGSKLAYYEMLQDETEKINAEIIAIRNRYRQEGRTSVTFPAILRKVTSINDRLDELIAQERKYKKPLYHKKVLTYRWEGPIPLREKFRTVVSENLIIAPKDPTDFGRIFFKGIVITDELIPLVWRSQSATELKFFIDRIVSMGWVKRDDNALNKQLEYCFVKSNGAPLSKDFRNIRISENKKLGKKTIARIEYLLNEIAD